MSGLAKLLTTQASIIPYIKKYYPFRLKDERDYGRHIDRYRRTTWSCLPIDPCTNNVFCGHFYYKGWYTSDCTHPHHQSLDQPSVDALTEYGKRANAWSKANPPTNDEINNSKPRWTAFEPSIPIVT